MNEEFLAADLCPYAFSPWTRCYEPGEGWLLVKDSGGASQVVQVVVVCIHGHQPPSFTKPDINNSKMKRLELGGMTRCCDAAAEAN